jgi:hypothetical protein
MNCPPAFWYFRRRYAHPMASRLDPEKAADEISLLGNVTPLEPYPGRTNAPWLCRCNVCGSEIRPRLGNLRSGQGACRTCAGHRTSERQRLPEGIAVAEMRASGATPLAPYVGVKSAWLCRCDECGAEITPRLADVRKGHRPCNYCAKRASCRTRRADENLAVREMIEQGGVTPLVPYPGASRQWESRCNGCGRTVHPRLASIRRGHLGCTSCANVGKGMVSAEHAQSVMIKQGGVTPLVPYPGNSKPWRGVCNTCGAEVSPIYSRVALGNGGCRYCGIRAGAKARQTPEDQAIAEMIEAGATPLTAYPGTKTPWKCKCMNADCGRVVTPTLGNVRSGASPCKYCTDYGFAYGKPAIVYVLVHFGEGAYKVGVAGTQTGRLEMLADTGWNRIASYPFPTGADAVRAEQSIFARLQRRGIARGFVPKNRMPRGGHTETIDASAITRRSLLDLVRSARLTRT